MLDTASDGFWVGTLEASCPKEQNYRIALFTREIGTNTLHTHAGEVQGLGYVAGGALLTGYRVEEDQGEAVLHFDRYIQWFNADISARSALIYNETTGKSIRIIDFGRVIGVQGGIFEVHLSEQGVIRLGSPTTGTGT